jgi:hypothetical protein
VSAFAGRADVGFRTRHYGTDHRSGNNSTQLHLLHPLARRFSHSAILPVNDVHTTKRYRYTRPRSLMVVQGLIRYSTPETRLIRCIAREEQLLLDNGCAS